MLIMARGRTRDHMALLLQQTLSPGDAYISFSTLRVHFQHFSHLVPLYVTLPLLFPFLLPNGFNNYYGFGGHIPKITDF